MTRECDQITAIIRRNDPTDLSSSCPIHVQNDHLFDQIMIGATSAQL